MHVWDFSFSLDNDVIFTYHACTIYIVGSVLFTWSLSHDKASQNLLNRLDSGLFDGRGGDVSSGRVGRAFESVVQSVSGSLSAAFGVSLQTFPFYRSDLNEIL